MKVIIAGDRNTNQIELVIDAILESGFEITEVVSGCARGVDTLGEGVANLRGWLVKRFPADWDRYGKAAGPIRNGQMAEYADALIALLTPDSRGTRDMIGQAERRGLKVYIKELKESNMPR